MLIYLKDLTQEEAKAEAKKRKGHILLNREIDDLTRQGILHPNLLLWTGTHVKYSEIDCTVTEDGKSTKIKLPESSGWYLQDKFGIPSGNESDDKDPEARWLSRITENDCLLVRWGGFVGDGRRYVFALVWPSIRLGVLIDVPSGAKKK